MSEGSDTPHDGTLSSESLSLLRSAPKPRAMTLAERQIAAKAVAQIATTPAMLVGGMTATKLTLATVATTTIGAGAMLARSLLANTNTTDRALQPRAPITAPALPRPSRSEPTTTRPTTTAQTQHNGTQHTVTPPTETRGTTGTVVRHTNSSQAVTVLPSSAPTVARAAVDPRPHVRPVSAAPVRESAPTPSSVAQPPALAATIGGSHSLAGGTLSEPSEQRETAALEQVFSVIASDPGRALAMLAAFDREFPHGRLRDEREFLGVLALERLGRVDEARARAQALLQRSPASIYAPRLRRLLERSP
jgi:hypothetical protein